MPDKRLVVIGNGSEMVKIKRNKAKSNIEILGYQPDSVMLEHMQNAKAFVFAAEEDFGITPGRSSSLWYTSCCIWKRW